LLWFAGYVVTVIETRMVQAVKVLEKVTAEFLEFQSSFRPVHTALFGTGHYAFSGRPNVRV
jgi:hypothetical protein